VKREKRGMPSHVSHFTFHEIKLKIAPMSIVTKTGDDGTTALMYGRRVPKIIRACKRTAPWMN